MQSRKKQKQNKNKRNKGHTFKNKTARGGVLFNNPFGKQASAMRAANKASSMKVTPSIINDLDINTKVLYENAAWKNTIVPKIDINKYDSANNPEKEIEYALFLSLKELMPDLDESLKPYDDGDVKKNEWRGWTYAKLMCIIEILDKDPTPTTVTEAFIDKEFDMTKVTDFGTAQHIDKIISKINGILKKPDSSKEAADKNQTKLEVLKRIKSWFELVRLSVDKYKRDYTKIAKSVAQGVSKGLSKTVEGVSKGLSTAVASLASDPRIHINNLIEQIQAIKSESMYIKNLIKECLEEGSNNFKFDGVVWNTADEAVKTVIQNTAKEAKTYYTKKYEYINNENIIILQEKDRLKILKTNIEKSNKTDSEKQLLIEKSDEIKLDELSGDEIHKAIDPIELELSLTGQKGGQKNGEDGKDDEDGKDEDDEDGDDTNDGGVKDNIFNKIIAKGLPSLEFVEPLTLTQFKKSFAALTSKKANVSMIGVSAKLGREINIPNESVNDFHITLKKYIAFLLDIVTQVNVKQEISVLSKNAYFGLLKEHITLIEKLLEQIPNDEITESLNQLKNIIDPPAKLEERIDYANAQPQQQQPLVNAASEDDAASEADSVNEITAQLQSALTEIERLKVELADKKPTASEPKKEYETYNITDEDTNDIPLLTDKSKEDYMLHVVMGTDKVRLWYESTNDSVTTTKYEVTGDIGFKDAKNKLEKDLTELIGNQISRPVEEAAGEENGEENEEENANL